MQGSDASRRENADACPENCPRIERVHSLPVMLRSAERASRSTTATGGAVHPSRLAFREHLWMTDRQRTIIANGVTQRMLPCLPELHGCNRRPAFPAPSVHTEGRNLSKPRAGHAARLRKRVLMLLQMKRNSHSIIASRGPRFASPLIENIAACHGFSYTVRAMIPPLAPSCADVLLFDLGRVVLDIDLARVMSTWAGHAGCDAADLATRFVVDDSFKHHEIGRIDDAAFFANLRQLLGIGLTDAQFLEGWNALFAGEMPGIAPLLANAAKRMPLYAFSNTNPAHVAHFSTAYADVLGHFRDIFLSSTIGLRKPDAEAYDHVVKAIGVPASRILFFDDSAANIEGARARGLRAIHVTSTDDVARALTALEIVPG
jgi:HAD superfamily hydrolase (TIGR01509 family)